MALRLSAAGPDESELGSRGGRSVIVLGANFRAPFGWRPAVD